jgi:ABC-type amino acid transport system permease subunit
MPDLERGQMVAAVMYVIIALFLAGNVVSRQRRAALRKATIALYAAAVVVVLGLIALWLTGHET